MGHDSEPKYQQLLKRLAAMERVLANRPVRWAASSSPSPIPLICELSSPVGSPGTNTTAPELTYTITLNGTTYDGSFPVENRPFPKGVIITTATSGLCYFGDDGHLHLFTANEVWRVDPCTPPT